MYNPFTEICDNMATEMPTDSEYQLIYIYKMHVFFCSGSWKDLTFKPLNFDAMGVLPTSGYLHPLLKIRAEYRQIFLEMGWVL